MYEDYPFWHAFFTKLGYRVLPSSEQLRDIPTEAMETIPSYSECFPAKLAHAHVYDLAKNMWISSGTPASTRGLMKAAPTATTAPW